MKRTLVLAAVASAFLAHAAAKNEAWLLQTNLLQKSEVRQGGALPRVLILGDSISLGYTPLVKAKLVGAAEVSRPGCNCGPSQTYLREMGKWIGTNRWAVIHVNFGIWDNHYLKGSNAGLDLFWGKEITNSLPAIAKGTAIRDLGFRIRTPIKEYERNLRTVLAFLKEHADHVVFGLTTPVCGWQKDDRCGRIRVYNELAANVCAEMGVGVTDLYAVAERNLDKQTDGVHFNRAGYDRLADAVAESIRKRLAAVSVRQEDDVLEKLVAEDVAKPVRPALAGGQLFWNGNARLFMYPPSFDFKPVAGAVKYRYRVLDDRLAEHTFESDDPTATLEPVWMELPVGWVRVEVLALDAKGEVRGTAGSRQFWKSAPYRPGAYPKPEVTIRKCVEDYFVWLYGMKNTRLVRETGEGDPDYDHNCYPSKMYAALARGLVRYADLCPARRDEILLTARRCCDFLIAISQPKGAPLEFFPPTYRGTRFTAGKYAGTSMLIYPADAALAYLAVRGATKDAKYLEAAERIAATYLRLQGADGTWCLKLQEKDGRPVCENRLFPIRVVEFLEELYRLTGKEAYRVAADRAFAFIERGPLTDWNWEGQFEDVKPSVPYQNLTKHPACETALYLLGRHPGDRAAIARARELLRFAEDQFVCWEMPARADLSSSPLEIEDGGGGVRHWRILPAALEQYGWYVPIDASNAKLIRTYLALYRAEGNPLDLAKARTLGDSIVRAQTAVGTGSIPTQWIDWDMRPTSEPWLNAGVASALALLELSEFDFP